MKAVLYRSFGGPEVLEFTEVPEPDAREDEVVVRLENACVAPFDWKLRAGLLTQHFETTFPKIPGRDGAGWIDAVGANVRDLRLGQRVCVMASHHQGGTYAEKIVVSRKNVVNCPQNLSSMVAVAGLNAGINAYNCYSMADIRPSQRVLVQGGGGAVGGLLVQLCRSAGAEVIATCRGSNCDYVIGLGAQKTIAYDFERFDHLREIDVVFDLIGGDVHDRSYKVLRKGGTLVYLHALPIFARGAEFGVSVKLGYTGDDENPEALRRVLELAEAGTIVPQVADLMPLRHAAAAHERLAAGEISRGRLVLTIP